MNAPEISNEEYSHITDVGCVRELNEDSLYCSKHLWLVADGMGGHACGEVASKLAVEEIIKQYNQTGNLSAAIQDAHHKIHEVSNKNSEQSGMGTTIVALLNSGAALGTNSGFGYNIAWVGDSRAYLWEKAPGKLTQISEDHSLMTRLINANLITAEEAISHPKRHMITQCLGSVGLEKVQVDTLKGNWKAKQQILLCSDGLTDELSDKEIAFILKMTCSNDEKIKLLVDKAKLAGGKDNITIILVDSPRLEDSNIWNKLKSIFT